MFLYPCYVRRVSLLKKKQQQRQQQQKQTYECNKKQIKLPGFVGLDVGASSFLVIPGWMSSSTSGLRGGDDVPYNIKDQL